MKISIMTMCVAAWACLIAFVIFPQITQEDNTYGGQLTFSTIEAYEEFKSDLKQRITADGLTLEDYDVLASEPPIIVNFEVVVPYDYELPYGDLPPLDSTTDIVLVVFVSIMAGLFIVFIPAMVMWRKGDEG